MKNYQKDFEEWKEYGNDIKEVREKLIKIICSPKYQNLLKSKKINWKLNRALDFIDKFKHLAEERMFQKVNPPQEDRWIEIFYGTDKEK